MAFDGNQNAYVDFHHLTEIPLSISKWKHKQFSIQTIEEGLHQKLAQRCTTDKHLYNEILRLFVDQYKRGGKDTSRVTGIDQKDFHQILTILGLFATEEQAKVLFEKYDANGSGNLSIHEFWVQARPQDYRSLPGFDDKQHVDEMIMNRARKRMYIKESLLHTSVEPPTPHPSVYSLPTERLLNGIRDKIRQNSVVDQTLSTQKTRHYLMKLFQYHDEARRGYCGKKVLQRVLDYINYAVGDHYIDAFVRAYPGPQPETVDYQRLCFAVYPQAKSAVLTSGYGQQSAHQRGVERKRLADRFKSSQYSRPSTVGNAYSSGSMTARTSMTPQRPVSSQGNHTARPRTGAGRPISRPGSRAGPPQQPSPRPPSTSRRSRPASRQYMAQATSVGC